MRTRGWDAGSLRSRQREGDADYHFRLNLNGATLGKGPVGSPTGQDFQWTWMPVEPTHGRLLQEADHGSALWRTGASIRLPAQEGGDVEVAVVVAELGHRRGRRLGGGAAARRRRAAAAAAEHGPDAAAGARAVRIGDLVDQHARGAVALALVVDELHLRAPGLARLAVVLAGQRLPRHGAVEAGGDHGDTD